MNNRYNYDRRRSYGNRIPKNENNASSIAVLICVLFGLGIWIATLKSDIRSLYEKNQMIEEEKIELEHKLDSIYRLPKPVPAPIKIEEPPKKIRKPKADTAVAKPIETKTEQVPTVPTDTTKTSN